MVRTLARMSALACVIAAAAPAQAASYKVLHAFLPGTDGTVPRGNLTLVGKTLYGTTNEGGLGCQSPGCGTIFAIDPTTGAEHVVHDFKGGGDGAAPYAGLLNVGGILYGTTYGGGNYQYGTVFSFNPATLTVKILHAFNTGSGGALPIGPLISVSGILYGTTSSGGSASCSGGCGTIFSLNPATGAEQRVFAFPRSQSGWFPAASLIDVDSKLLGTTLTGGHTSEHCVSGCGTIFQFNTVTGIESTVHDFTNSPDGDSPQAGLARLGQMLYGTTALGGQYGRGSVYRLDPKQGTEKILYAFQGGRDGAGPAANVMNLGGLLFGTTATGGSSEKSQHRYGTIFSVNPATGKHQVLHAFQGGNDGALPMAGLINLHGTLYGTTAGGGSTFTCTYTNAGCGTVFAYTPY